LFTPHADRRRCGKPVTLPDNLRAGSKEIAFPAEPFKKLDVRGSGIRAGGMIAIPLPNIGSMGGECGPLRKCAIAERLCRRNYDNWGCLHEIYGRQALDRGRWPQNEREPRGCILERVERHRSERHMTLSELVAEIDARRQFGNLSSALRLFVLEQMMAGRATLFEHTKALENEARAHSSAALCASSAGLK
jgi:predicted DNA-binding ribbon-helix-helix protein